jgi:hypothetical protein
MKTNDGKEVAACMHIREIELCPAQFDMPLKLSGLWLCHGCFSTMLFNLAQNAKEYNNGY